MKPKILLPTRICNDIKTLIDNMFWSLLNKYLECSSARVPECPSSLSTRVPKCPFKFPHVLGEPLEYLWNALGVSLECSLSAKVPFQYSSSNLLVPKCRLSARRVKQVCNITGNGLLNCFKSFSKTFQNTYFTQHLLF